MRTLLTLLLLSPLLAWAQVRLEPAQIQQLAELEEGTQVLLAPGTYPPLVIDRTLSIRAEPGALVEGGAVGHAVQLLAPGIRLQGLTIRNWGDDLGRQDAGIYVGRQAKGAVIQGNVLQGPAFGIWVDATAEVTIADNRIQGDQSLRSQDRGNGIHLFNVSGARVEGNEIWHTRDGIYIDTSNNNVLARNHLHDLRYGIHYMYSHHNQVLDNLTERTRTGYALMQSKFLEVRGNQSRDDQNYGILMNYITYSTLVGNRVSGVRASRGLLNSKGGEGKAFFVYNSVGNTLSHNHVFDSDLAIHLTAGSDQNRIFANAFVGNQAQVKYVSTRSQEWSHEGQGNYWSDYLGWDMNGDGQGDLAYEPNDGMDQLLWRYPSARFLFNSPAVELLRWVQRSFPVFKAQGVKDSHPLMAPPQAPALMLAGGQDEPVAAH
ncbi:nitrous oxide reductase family maturation protein NosD [Gallaecimonas sp. GXIMD4217]|uniref:nitrous oxide reductase family maturation protein NosD n=1 Tax=Gallaecimonas sp. GXIMD4217 TaxID=3131927 RepID=UPI00311B181B